MKKVTLLGFLLVAVHILNAKPSYEGVIRELYTHYFVPNYGQDTNLVFEKKREGWFVAKTVFNFAKNYNDVVKEELFWSATEHRYLNLTMFRKGETPLIETRVKAELAQATPYSYERCPYYGYDGWPLDVIADYGGISFPADDTLLEGLARAYDTYALGYIRVQYIKDQNLQLDLPDSAKCTGIMKYQEAAIKCYDVLRKRNRHYKTIVGEVSTTYYNAIMEYYDFMLFFDHEEEVRKYFTEEFYDPCMRGIAEGQLRNCDSSAILFTWGDTDTYPMWYLQQVKGIRTDVLVICGSFLNLPEYINRYREGNEQSTGTAAFTISRSNYSMANGYFYATGSSLGKVNAKDGLSYVSETSDNVYGTNKVCYRPFTMMFVKSSEMFSEFELIAKTDTVYVQLNRSYYPTSDVAMIDLIATNYTKRPIYFTIGYPTWLLESYLVNEGMVRRFIPAHLTKLTDWVWGASYSRMGDKAWSAMSGSGEVVDSTCARLWIYNYKIMMYQTALALAIKDPAKSARLLKTAEGYFNNDIWFNENIEVYGALTYYKLKRLEEADRKSVKILDICEKRMKEKSKQGQQDEQAESIVFCIQSAANEAGSIVIAERAKQIRATYWRPK